MDFSLSHRSDGVHDISDIPMRTLVRRPVGVLRRRRYPTSLESTASTTHPDGRCLGARRSTNADTDRLLRRGGGNRQVDEKNATDRSMRSAVKPSSPLTLTDKSDENPQLANG